MSLAGQITRRRGHDHLPPSTALTPRHEPVEVVVGQTVQRELTHRPRDLLRGLEPARKAAHQRRLRPRQLIGGDRPLAADVGNLAQHVLHRLRRRVGLHARLHDERPGLAAEVEAERAP